jgi:hypothetical protein
MMKRFLTPLTASLLFSALVFSAPGLMACNDEDVGVLCKTGDVSSGGGTSSKILITGALDCLSRLCYLKGDVSDATAQCTKICETNDDCPESGINCPNNERYVCVVGKEVIGEDSTSSLGCCKICVCKAFVSDDEIKNPPGECAGKTPNCPKL